jgi:hypothetical protein
LCAVAAASPFTTSPLMTAPAKKFRTPLKYKPPAILAFDVAKSLQSVPSFHSLREGPPPIVAMPNIPTTIPLSFDPQLWG